MDPVEGLLFVQVWRVTKEDSFLWFDSTEREFFYVTDSTGNRQIIANLRDNDDYVIKHIEIYEKAPVKYSWRWRVSRPELFRSGYTSWREEVSSFHNLSGIMYEDPNGTEKYLETSLVHVVEIDSREKVIQQRHADD